MRRLSALLVSSVLLATASCGSSSASTTGPNTATGLLNGTFSATINGAAWSAIGRVAVVRTAGNSLAIAGVSTTYGVTLSLFNAAAPGTYPLTTNVTVGSFAIVSNSNGMSWTTGVLGGTGTVTITTLTASRVAGTFTFDAMPSTGGATTTTHITSGTFDVTY